MGSVGDCENLSNPNQLTFCWHPHPHRSVPSSLVLVLGSDLLSKVFKLCLVAQWGIFILSLAIEVSLVLRSSCFSYYSHGTQSSALDTLQGKYLAAFDFWSFF
ncbi:hypothetical protein KC19_3G051200 [Ceratodon purpureus]|uniref:Uncharacterized protein n=1 Tax=Ceratodon purpureus TaxID=3225 RepID=A0A8T0IHF0_CERPU|nr:hypothetical protein KC19_3G051200 [Ceratodon purpureus]